MDTTTERPFHLFHLSSFNWLVQPKMASGLGYLVDCNKRHHFDIFSICAANAFLTAFVRECFRDAPGTKPVV